MPIVNLNHCLNKSFVQKAREVSSVPVCVNVSDSDLMNLPREAFMLSVHLICKYVISITINAKQRASRRIVAVWTSAHTVTPTAGNRLVLT